jgi:shikimate kinase
MTLIGMRRAQSAIVSAMGSPAARRLPGVSPARVLLIGMMGSGKSSVGRALAERTGWPFVDNDELVQRATGRTARELVADGGEPALRAAESAALGEGVRIEPPVIVATAAGTILDPDDRRLLDDSGLAVWLRAPINVLVGRATGAEHRPWLETDPAGWMATALAAREPLYASIADLEIDTSRVAPRDAAELVVHRLADDT